jgi:hypothetical protein
MKKIFIVSLLIIGMLGVFSPPAMAASYDVCGKELSIEGFVRQEFAFGVSEDNRLKTNQSGLHSAYQMWYLDTDLWLTKDLEVRGILRMWGDLAYQLLKNNSRFEKYFYRSKHNLNWDTEWDQVLRELYITYSNPKFFIRLGKQQVGWGETDGMRLMDCINPLDIRRGPFYDTQGYEEVRIPKWLIRTEFFGGNFGRFYNTSLELIWNPGDIQVTGNLLPTEIVNAQQGGGAILPPDWLPTNATGVPVSSQGSWGIWGIPVNFVPLPVKLVKKEPGSTLNHSEYGGRLKFSINNTNCTINFWKGFQADEVLDFQGIFPNAKKGGIFPPITGGSTTPVYLLMNRAYLRMMVAGFTLSRELDGVGPLFCQPANPVLRVEALYDFQHPFNTGRNTATDFIKIKKYDQIKYVIGVDWPVRCGFINPQKNIFLSGQFIHIYTLHWRNGVDSPRPAPFYSWTYPMNQFYSSLLVRTEYKNETIVPSALLVWDHSNNSAWIKSACSFKYGDHWRPEIGWLWIKKNTSMSQVNPGPNGRLRDDWKAFGTFEDRDEVYIRIQYQF